MFQGNDEYWARGLLLEAKLSKGVEAFEVLMHTESCITNTEHSFIGATPVHQGTIGSSLV